MRTMVGDRPLFDANPEDRTSNWGMARCFGAAGTEGGRSFAYPFRIDAMVGSCFRADGRAGFAPEVYSATNDVVTSH